MTDTEAKRTKAKCLDEVRKALPRYREVLEQADERLWQYAEDCVREDVDIHCLDEVLQLRGFLRRLDTYEFDAKFLRMLLLAAEGEWKDGKWVRGGLRFDGIYGYRHYRLTMSQVYILAGIYGFKHWVNTHSPNGSREMMTTERQGNEGTIEDRRRLTTTYIAMIPRKYGKTFLGAFVQFEGMMFEERDYEGYICANSADQSKLLFTQLRKFLREIDPDGKYFRYTATEINWLPNTGKEGSVTALTAGGKTKDGLKAQYCSADEFGAAIRVKDHCDMEGLINVVTGSMGPRREPLTMHTSTAGLGNETPYEEMINRYSEDLLKEMEIPLDGRAHERDSDWRCGLILRPDQWERDEQTMREPRVWRKVNPHLGTTIQPNFYANEWGKADQEGELKKKEVISKLFNVFQSAKAVDWVTADEIQRIQLPMKVDNLNPDDGWMCFIGCDFSKGNDLNAISYLCFNPTKGEFFADMDAWVCEDMLTQNTNNVLYQMWQEQGHLRVSPGSTIDEMLVLQRIIEVSDHCTIVRIGYDAYDAKRFINAMSAWIFGQGLDPKEYIRPVSQSFGATNSPVQELDYLIKRDPALIHFSANPMWAWEFTNAFLEEDKFGNVRPMKSARNAKVDNVQALLSALILYDEMNGTSS